MSFKRILCPIDFSPGAEQALKFATRLAIQHNSELIVFHAWHLPAAAYTLEYPMPPEVTQEILGEAQSRLELAAEKSRKSGALQVRTELVSGIAWVEITRMLDNRGIDLCVIGAHGHSALSRVFLGSVAEKVVRHAHCSVLVIPPNCEPRAFTNVLVPTDFSASAETAMKLAASLVDRAGTLHLMHCIELPVMYGTRSIPPFDYDASATEWLAREAAKLNGQAGVQVVTSYRVGPPVPEILDVLEHKAAMDLVVMGSHGRTGIKRVLLGSVAERIVRHAVKPVLIAR